MNSELLVYSINGPVVTVKGKTDLKMLEMVHVGHSRLIGEVISVSDKATTIQVYESTTGLRAGEPVISSGSPMICTLAPGMLEQIYDGIARPLSVLEQMSGPFIASGIESSTVDLKKLWNIKINVKLGQYLSGGEIIAECTECTSFVHKIMLPPNLSGKVSFIAPNGSYTVEETLIKVLTDSGAEISVNSIQKWPIRTPRPYKKRLVSNEPLITGQRVIDTLFPIVKGGAAAIPGGFGTGKTMTQHQLAKWCDADIIVYVGCGERGNEMTQVLTEFGELIDPRTGKSMLERVVLIANTSNMPVAAREASIYTGITIAEYFRDMGYHVALMADSTSRWAEALREISGRLEEMPAEEGYPAYLPSRLSAFYERAGLIITNNDQKASVTLIGAVSPQGNDFSEPVTQNTKRFTRCFWALEKSLAYARHYPAINWITSYSEYTEDLEDWYRENVAEDFLSLRAEMTKILGEENTLMEIVKLIGADLLAENQKLILDIAKLIRTGFLQQNAMNKNDTYVPLKKQYYLMRTIITLYYRSKALLEKNISMSKIRETGIFDKVVSSRYTIENDKLELFATLDEELKATLQDLEKQYE